MNYLYPPRQRSCEVAMAESPIVTYVLVLVIVLLVCAAYVWERRRAKAAKLAA